MTVDLRPVLVIGFNRPDFLEKTLQGLLFLDRKIYISIDGPRNSHDENKVKKTIEIAEEFSKLNDTETKIRVNRSNLGCRLGVQAAIDWFFEFEVSGIILEDDIDFDIKFLDFCDANLKIYEKENRIFTISGNNFVSEIVTKTLVLSRIPHVWGWATWKSRWEMYDREINNWNPNVWPAWFQELELPIRYKKILSGYFFSISEFKTDTWDYQLIYTSLKNNLVNIHPKFNMNSNIGFNLSATHTKNYLNKPKLEKNSHLVDVSLQKLEDYTINNAYDTKYLATRNKFRNRISEIFNEYV